MLELPCLRRDDLYSYGDKEGRPGWRRLVKGKEDGRLIMLRLPCGHVCCLGKDHEVQSDGTVVPLVLCAAKTAAGRKCKKFNDHVVLKGWSP